MAKVFLRNPPDPDNILVAKTLQKLSGKQRQFYEQHKDCMKVEIATGPEGLRVYCRTCKQVAK
jgi:hypothetical protein